jgi:hypothetical protein
MMRPALGDGALSARSLLHASLVINNLHLRNLVIGSILQLSLAGRNLRRAAGRKSAVVKKLQASSAVGASTAPRNVESSFCRGCYSSLTNLDLVECEVMYHEFVESSLVVKPEPVSD